MGKLNRAKTWLTGRNGIYADEDKVEEIKEQLTTINNDLKSVKDEIANAIDQLNACTGFTEYVSQGNLDRYSFDPVIEAGENAVQILQEQIQAKIDDITTYSNASLPKKAFATWTMVHAKVGEGLLSVGEDLLDSAVSVVGWASGVAGEDNKLQKACKNFVKKEWSHDAFNFYYKSSLAKASAFTEDSAIAGGLKIAGSTVGYLALAGATAGAGAAGAASWGAKAASLASKGTKGAKILSYGAKGLSTAGKVVGTTTRANTVLAAAAGLGSGTESGLRQGKSMNRSFGKGVVQGAIQGTVAYGFGKLGERAQKNAAVKEASGEVDDAAKKVLDAETDVDIKQTGYDEAVKTTKEAKDTFRHIDERGVELKKYGKQLDEIRDDFKKFSQETKKNHQSTWDDIVKKYEEHNVNVRAHNAEHAAAKTKLGNLETAEANAKAALQTATEGRNAAKGVLDAAEKNLSNVKNTKLSNFDGYFDPVTKAGQKFGTNAKETFKSGVSAVGQKATTVKAGVSSAAGTAKELGVKGTAKAVVGKAVTPIKSTVSAAKELGVKGTAKAIGGGAVAAGKAVVGGTVATGKAVVNNPGTTGAVLNATGREISNKLGNKRAEQQFKYDFDNAFNQSTNDTLPSGESKKPDIPDTPDYGPDGYRPGGYTPGSDGGNGGGSSSSSGGGTQKRKTTTPSSKKDNSKPTDPNKKADDVLTPDKDNSKPDQEIVTPPSQVDTEPQDEVITPITPDQPSDITPDTSIPVDRQTLHTTGGSYSESDGYSSTGESYNNDGGYTDNYNDASEAPVQTPEVAPYGDIENPIDGIIKKGDYTKIPKSDDPITTTSKSGGSSVIPIAAGLSAAAAAGIGAKAYMDRKRNNDVDEDFDSEEWDGDEDIDMKYDSGVEKQEYLDDNEDFGIEEPEKYGARSNQELADVQ